MTQENSSTEEPIRFTDKRRIDPETGEARQPVEDPLEQAEDILADVPDEAVEVEQAHEEPAGEEESPQDPLVAEAPETAEEPELQEVDREAELEDDLRRVQAEYVNYRRRVERDRGLEKERVKGQLISELMPVLDDISAARAAGDLEDGPFAHIAGRLEQILSQEGLAAVGAVGEKFDPTEHEAIMQQPHEEVEADHIAVLIRSGYRFGDRLLRAAQVIVSTGPDN